MAEQITERQILDILNSNLIKEFGTAALMFGCFYLILQLTAKNLEALINQQKDFINKTFEMLKSMIECNLMNTSLLQEIKDKIETNSWCPYSRKLLNHRENDNE